MPAIERNGKRLCVAQAFGTSRLCACGCGEMFVVTSITGRQLYATSAHKERALWRREAMRPDTVRRSRERSRAWAAENRGVTQSNPWLLGAPAYGQYLPGGAFSLRVTPPPKWAIELRNTRGLHGLATALVGVPHDAHMPMFSLIPSASSPLGWGLYVAAPESALRLAGRQVDSVLFDRRCLVTCGPMFRIKAPRVTKRGHRRLRIDCLTPVLIRSDGGKRSHTSPTAANLCSTLATWTPQRLGAQLGESDIQIKIVERHTHAEWTDMGGKFGHVGGFVGHLIVDTNAVGEWLLRCCETIGFGGRTAFGFGRIRVTAC